MTQPNFIARIAHRLALALTGGVRHYYDPLQARASDGKWTSEKDQAAYHAGKADSLKNGNSKKRHLATALAAAALHSIKQGQSPDGHLKDMAKVVEALRIQVHHAKNGKKAHTAAQIKERQDAYEHYRVMLNALKAHAGGKGDAPEISHFEGDLDDEEFKAKTGGKSIAAAQGKAAPAAAPAPAADPVADALSAASLQAAKPAEAYTPEDHLAAGQALSAAGNLAPPQSEQMASLKNAAQAHFMLAGANGNPNNLASAQKFAAAVNVSALPPTAQALHSAALARSTPAPAPVPLLHETLGLASPSEHAAMHAAQLQQHTTLSLRGSGDAHMAHSLAMAHHWAGVATSAANEGKTGKAKMALHLLDGHLNDAHAAGQQHGGNPEQADHYDTLKNTHDLLAKEMGVPPQQAAPALPAKPVSEWTPADHAMMAAHLKTLPTGTQAHAAYHLMHAIEDLHSTKEAVASGDSLKATNMHGSAQSELNTALSAGVPPHLTAILHSALSHATEVGQQAADLAALAQRSGEVSALHGAVAHLPLGKDGMGWNTVDHLNAAHALKNAALLTGDAAKKGSLTALGAAHTALAKGNVAGASTLLAQVDQSALPADWHQQTYLSAMSKVDAAHPVPVSQYNGHVATPEQHMEAAALAGKAAAAYEHAGKTDAAASLKALQAGHLTLAHLKSTGNPQHVKLASNAAPHLPASHQPSYVGLLAAEDAVNKNVATVATPAPAGGTMSAADHDTAWHVLEQQVVGTPSSAPNMHAALDSLQTWHAKMEGHKKHGSGTDEGELHNLLNDTAAHLTMAQMHGEPGAQSLAAPLKAAAAEHAAHFGGTMNPGIEKAVHLADPTLTAGSAAPAAPAAGASYGTAPAAGSGKWSWGRYGYDKGTHEALSDEIAGAEGKYADGSPEQQAMQAAAKAHAQMSLAVEHIQNGNTAMANLHLKDVKAGLTPHIKTGDQLAPEAQAALKSAAGAFNAIKDAHAGTVDAGKLFLGKKGKGKKGQSSLLEAHAWKLGEDNAGTPVTPPTPAAPAGKSYADAGTAAGHTASAQEAEAITNTLTDPDQQVAGLNLASAHEALAKAADHLAGGDKQAFASSLSLAVHKLPPASDVPPSLQSNLKHALAGLGNLNTQAAAAPTAAPVAAPTPPAPATGAGLSDADHLAQAQIHKDAANQLGGISTPAGFVQNNLAQIHEAVATGHFSLTHGSPSAKQSIYNTALKTLEAKDPLLAAAAQQGLQQAAASPKVAAPMQKILLAAAEHIKSGMTAPTAQSPIAGLKKMPPKPKSFSPNSFAMHKALDQAMTSAKEKVGYTKSPTSASTALGHLKGIATTVHNNGGGSVTSLSDGDKNDIKAKLALAKGLLDAHVAAGGGNNGLAMAAHYIHHLETHLGSAAPTVPSAPAVVAATKTPAKVAPAKLNLSTLPPTVPDKHLGTSAPSVQAAADLKHKFIKSAGAGSNNAQFYAAPDGTQHVVKTYSKPGQAYGEHLANQTYAALGIPVAATHIAPDGQGNLLHASQVLDGGTEKPNLTPQEAHTFLKGFMGDVLTSNWDAVGSGGDNLMRGKDGQIYRIDNGGSLLYRAQGSPKTDHDLGNLTELDSFFSKNKDYANVLGKAGVRHWTEIPEVEQQIKQVASLSDADLEKMAAPVPGMPEAERQKVLSTLKKRRDLIAALPAQLAAAKAAAAAAAAAAGNQMATAAEKAHVAKLQARSGDEVHAAVTAGQFPLHVAKLAYAKKKLGFQHLYSRNTTAPTSKAEAQAIVDDMAGRGIMSPTQLTDAQWQNIQEVGKHFTAGHAAKIHQALGIIQSGHIGTSHHGLKGNAGDNPHSTKRHRLEEKIKRIWHKKDGADFAVPFGAPSTMPAMDAAKAGQGHRWIQSSSYGGVRFAYHPHVKERTVYYNGDTWNLDHAGGKAQFEQQGMNHHEAAILYGLRKESSAMEGIAVGGINMEDVHHMEVSNATDAKQVHAALKAKGLHHIPVYITGGPHGSAKPTLYQP